MAEGASVAGASAKAVAGRGGGAVAFSAVRKPPANADNVGGWGAEDTDDDRPSLMQVMCDV
jgi:hypothetical protein